MVNTCQISSCMTKRSACQTSYTMIYASVLQMSFNVMENCYL